MDEEIEDDGGSSKSLLMLDSVDQHQVVDSSAPPSDIQPSLLAPTSTSARPMPEVNKV